MECKLISVDDEMPEIGQNVLIFEKYCDGPCVAYLSKKFGGTQWLPDETFIHYYGYSKNLIENSDVTHWMELPPMPWKEK